MPVERLAAFYKKYYQPDNAVLAIGGRFDESEDAAIGGGDDRARFRAPRASSTRPTRSSRRRMASVTWNCGAWARDRK